MNILYTTNSKFVGKVAASICSVFENNRDMDTIKIYIIGQELTEEECLKFNTLGEQYNREIVIIALDNISQYFKFTFDTNGWNPIVLARLLLDYFLPEDLEKVLYLDGDTINIAPLKELWETDLRKYILGACIEATVDSRQLEILNMEGRPYVNAGVLLINLKAWREKKAGEKIIRYYEKHNGMLFANDQDAINGALQGEILFLPPKYNFYNIYWYYPYKFLKKFMGKAYYYNEAVYKESQKNPAIIHYLGEERPWRAGNKHKFKEDYKKYLSKTPWKDEADEGGWEVYFLCWNLFNRIMTPFPGIRYSVINGLIPLFMKYRKLKLKREK